LISAYTRAANEPTEVNLNCIAKALGIKPDELLSPLTGEGASPLATATTTIDGKTRLVVDAVVDAETALKIIALVRGATRNVEAA
jgi:transcriptional regulator with XRE-family HTH domain